MTRKLLLFSLALSGLCAAQNGIWVDQPKVYDDHYLQLQLNTLKARLAALNGTDQATLLSHIGTAQSVNSVQTGLSIQASGPGTTQTSVLTAPPAASAPAGESGAYGTTTTYPSLTPSIPGASANPAPATALPFPSALATSPVDALNEQMQLSYQITNLQLLIDGSLDDRFSRGTQKEKRHLTAGFDITIDVPDNLKKDVKDAIAEVEITVSNTQGQTESPSIMTLLPREKTYNVAGMVQHSLSLGAGGILAGVVNLGVNWGFVKQKAYLYKQQDTLALQQAPNKFTWQFRPVLEQRYVQPGTRQNFVQFSAPLPDGGNCATSAHIEITTRWRAVDKKTGLPGAVVGAARVQSYDLSYFDTTPISQSVDVHDLGAGNVLVRAGGYFLVDGLSIRVGKTILGPGSPNFLATDNAISFVASAQDILTGGAYIIGRDGLENEIKDAKKVGTLPACASPPAKDKTQPSGEADSAKSSDPKTPGAAPIENATQSSSSVQQSSPTKCPGTQTPSDGRFGFCVKSLSPFSSAQSQIELAFWNPPELSASGVAPIPNPLLITIGNQIFGLRDKPFRAFTIAADRKSGEISAIVPTDLLRSEREISLRRLLRGSGESATIPIPKDQISNGDFSVAGASLVVDGDPLSYILVTGTGMKGATIVTSALAPPPKPKIPPAEAAKKTEDPGQTHCVEVKDPTHDTYLVVTVLKSCASQTKQFLLTSGNSLPIAVALPSGGPPPDPAKQPIDPPSANIAPGAKNVTVKGPGLDQISKVAFGKTELQFVLSLKKDTLTIALLPDITSVEGVRFLDIETVSGQKSRLTLVVQKPAN